MKIRKPILTILILILLGLCIRWLSLDVCWLGDDLDYMFRMRGGIWESWGWIKTPQEFMASQWSHYLNVNGRFVAHALVQLFNGVLGQKIFALFNGLIYQLTVIILARVGGARLLSPSVTLTSIFLILFGFLTKMMPTCQIGYVWGLAINLLWAGLFLSGRTRSIWTIIGMSLLGIIAGNWQEAYSIGISGAVGIMLLSQWFRHPLRRLTRAQQIMAIAYIIGTATVCLAPSTISRAVNFTRSASSLTIISPPGWVYALLSFRIFYIFIGILIWRIVTGKVKLASFLFSQSMWVCTLILLLIFNIGIGIFCNRQLFGIEMCSAILTLRLLPSHTFGRLWSTLLCILIATLYFWQYTLSLEAKRQYDEIELLYQKSENGIVYFDRKRATNEGFTREAKIYEDIIGLYDNDPHHSIMKYLKHRYPGRRALIIIPESVKGIDWKDTVINYAPGHYILIGQPGDTVIIRATRFGKEIDRLFDFHKSLRGPKGYRIVSVSPSDPWLTFTENNTLSESSGDESQKLK